MYCVLCRAVRISTNHQVCVTLFDENAEITDNPLVFNESENMIA